MRNNIIDELNKLLTNTLGYREVIQELASELSHKTTVDKLNEFSNIAKKESETIIQVISELGGEVESSERQTDQKAVSWASAPLPERMEMQSVVEYLIEIERKKEDDYDKLLAHDEIDRKSKNMLKKHRKQAESNLLYFQTALQTLEKKS